MLCVVLMSGSLAGCAGAAADSTRITAVETLQQPVTEEAVFGFIDGVLPELPSAAARWTTTELPHARGRSKFSETDVEWTRVWYRTRYTVDPSIRERLLIYVPRFMTGNGSVDYFIDGRVIDFPGRDSSTRWNRPAFYFVPAEAQRRGHFELLITVWYQTRAGYMLAAPHIGTEEQLAPRASMREFLQRGAPQGMSYALIVLGLFAFGFWARHRHEKTYLLFAVATIVWFLRTVHYYSDLPAVAVELFWWISLNSLGWLMLVVYAFALRLQRQSARWPVWILTAIIAFTGVLTLPELWLTYSSAAMVSYVSQFVVAIAVTLLLTVDALRRGTIDTKVLAGALWINLAFGAHDLLLFSFRLDPELVFLMPYGALFLFGAFLFAVTRRYSRAISDVEQANTTLETRLNERTQQLEMSYERLRQIEKERAVDDERQRLMREMHDGLGSSLMSSLVLVQQGRLGSEEIAAVLRECIDDLKLTIDSLEPIGNDLVTLLATLRYRIGRRLEAAGLRLEWRAGDLPPLPWLDAVNALQVLRIVQEALTNVVKHSGARVIAIATSQDREGVSVVVEDDGAGFNVGGESGSSAAGRGLTNMRRRAELLGGRIEIASGASGTRLTLHLPLDRRAAPRAPAAVIPPA